MVRVQQVDSPALSGFSFSICVGLALGCAKGSGLLLSTRSGYMFYGLQDLEGGVILKHRGLSVLLGFGKCSAGLRGLCSLLDG